MYYADDYVDEGRMVNFMYKVYGWMALALCVTAGVAAYVASVPKLYLTVQHNPAILIGLFIAQIALVVALSMFIMKMSLPTAVLLFMLYAFSLGITLSMIFFVYNIYSIYATFLVTAGMFGAMSIYGYWTQTDLTRVGNIALMALIGIIIATLVNFFLQSPSMDFVISIFGVLIFTALTAYDTQKIRIIGEQLLAERETLNKIAVIGALTLYLDFINLFLFLLRFMGKRRD